MLGFCRYGCGAAKNENVGKKRRGRWREGGGTEKGEVEIRGGEEKGEVKRRGRWREVGGGEKGNVKRREA